MPRTRTAKKYRLWKNPSNGIWYVVTGSGKSSIRRTTGTRSYEEAERHRDNFEHEIKNPPPPGGSHVAYYLDRYYDEVGQFKRSAEVMRSNIKQLKPFFGNYETKRVTSKLLKEFAATKSKLKGGTILKMIGTLKIALKYAAGNRWIEPLPPLQNPVQASPARDLWLTRQQVRRLLDNCQAPHLRLYIIIGVTTAARMSAILQLKWEQVDRERGIINFGQGHGNKRRAIVPMNQDLETAIDLASVLTQTDYVIEFKGKPIKSIRRAFEKLCERCEIEASPHILRHTAATWMVMAGVPLSEVARVLGTNERTVERVYGKHAPDYLRRAVGQLHI